jgi:hypothetical protein
MNSRTSKNFSFRLLSCLVLDQCRTLLIRSLLTLKTGILSVSDTRDLT